MPLRGNRPLGFTSAGFGFMLVREVLGIGIQLVEGIMIRGRSFPAFGLITAVAVAVVLVLAGGGASTTRAAPGDPGTATITLVPSASSAALGHTLTVDVNLTQFAPGTGVPGASWGGYDLDIGYDTGVATATGSVIGGSSPCGVFWANTELTPDVVSGCSFQSQSVTVFPLETITFHCDTDGAVDLHLFARREGGADGSGTALFDEAAIDFSMTFVDASFSCGSSVVNTPTSTATPTITNTPSPTNTSTATRTPTNTSIPATMTAIAVATQTALANAPTPGTATITLVPSAGSAALGNSLTVAVNLSQFTGGFGVPGARWGGYDLDIGYDTGVATATGSVIGGSNPCGAFWANFQLTPDVLSGCVFQSQSVAVSPLETVTFRCDADGPVTLHLFARGEGGASGTGTALFDETAVDFNMTLNDASFSCGSATNTPTSTPTNTPVPIATPTPPECIPFGQKVSTTMNILFRFGSRRGRHRYNARYDLNNDGKIDWDDLEIILATPTCQPRHHDYRGHDD